MNLQWMKDVDQQLRELAQRTRHLGARERGGSGGGGMVVYKRSSAAALPASAEAHALGFITEGAEAGAWYERNSDNSGWQGRTIWHTS